MEANPVITLDEHEVVGFGTYGKVFIGTSNNQRFAVKRRYVVDNAPPGCIHVGEIDGLCRFRHPYILRAKTVQRQNPINDNFRSDKNDTAGSSASCTYRADLIYVLTEVATTDIWRMVTKPLPLERAIKYIQQILLAITYIHDIGFIHRDIKPHNILYFKDEDLVKICDFDMLLPNIEGYHSFKAMTPEYTPPEILMQGMEVTYTPKVDIWGAGMILKFLLSGSGLITRGDRRGDDIDRYILAIHRRFFPNGSCIPAEASAYDVSRDNIIMTTGIQAVDDLLSHMLDCSPDTRWDARMCLSHPLFNASIPRSIPVDDHVVERHFITDTMAKVFDAEFNSLTEPRRFGFFLGLDILMRVCRTKTRMDHKKLAICCFNIGMKYYDKEIAYTIPIDINDSKRIEYDVIVEKLQCQIYRDNVWNHIQGHPDKIYRYMLCLANHFPVRFSELCTIIKTHLAKTSRS